MFKRFTLLWAFLTWAPLAHAQSHPTVAGTSALINADVFNVSTYGAFGDGVHDDTAALQAAVHLCAPFQHG